MEENISFEDPESSRSNYGKDQICFRDIVLNHLRKISLLASVEFRGGFWETKLLPVGGTTGTIRNRVYISDTREIYSNSIEVFSDMLYVHFDKKMLEAEAEAVAELKKAYVSETVIVESTRTDSEEEEPQKKRVRTFKNTEDKIYYRDLRVQICRKLFRELCSFLSRKKYFVAGSMTD